MAIASMLCVQLGLAASVGLFDQRRPRGRRLAAPGLGRGCSCCWCGRDRATFTRAGMLAGVALGVVTAGMTLLFMAAVARLPLGTASALEFLGPLAVAVGRGRGAGSSGRSSPASASLLLTEPWHGGTDRSASRSRWPPRLLGGVHPADPARRRPGRGLSGLAVSMPVAGLSRPAVAGPSVVGDLTWSWCSLGLGLAVLLPVVPFSLEMLALRRLTAAAFGTLMSLEPAFALLVGVVGCTRCPGGLAVVGIAFVVTAGIGAERTGGRTVAGGSRSLRHRRADLISRCTAGAGRDPCAFASGVGNVRLVERPAQGAPRPVK